MALNSSGAISLGGSTTGQSVAVELGQSATAAISLNDTAVRTLAGVASGAISLYNLYSKSNTAYWAAVYSTGPAVSSWGAAANANYLYTYAGKSTSGSAGIIYFNRLNPATGEPIWTKQVAAPTDGTNAAYGVTKAVVDSSGNLYFAAYGFPFYIIKITNSGTVEWIRKLTLGYPSSYGFRNLSIDSADNVYILTYDPYAGVAYLPLLQKISSSGTSLWVSTVRAESGQQAGEPGNNGFYPNGLYVNAADNSVTMWGSWYGTSTANSFTPGIVTFNSDGSPRSALRSTTIGSGNNILGGVVDSSGNVYTLYGNGINNVQYRVVKTNSSGVSQWQITSGRSDLSIISMEINSNNVIYASFGIGSGGLTGSTYIWGFDSSGNTVQSSIEVALSGIGDSYYEQAFNYGVSPILLLVGTDIRYTSTDRGIYKVPQTSNLSGFFPYVSTTSGLTISPYSTGVGPVTATTTMTTHTRAVYVDYAGPSTPTNPLNSYSAGTVSNSTATVSYLAITSIGSSAKGSTPIIIPGSYTWVAPSGVSSVSVVAIGGGGGGTSDYTGGGGGLGWKNNISVTPGVGYNVVVGGGGGGTYCYYCAPGTDSYFINSTTVKGGGGGGGYNSLRTGGSYVGDGGGNGGNGGRYCTNGGGGAGGYSGNGGSGDSVGGNGGGGGSGFKGTTNRFGLAAPSGGGGGVSFIGQGPNGTSSSNPKYAGSYGGGWPNSSAYSTISRSSMFGGGGRSGAYYCNGCCCGGPNPGGTGGWGAVRIIWGSGRSFPSTDVGTP
jgi:hypothetical protein